MLNLGWILFAVLYATIALAESQVTPLPQERLTVSGRRIVTPQGAGVLLRGVNLSGDSNVPPFSTFRPSDLSRASAVGANLIRLIFNWEVFEPSPGKYNESYFNWYRSLLDEANLRGIYVLVDVHQGLFSRYLSKGCGEGFPRWAIPSDVAISPPDNGPACKYWFFGYADSGVQASFTNLLKPGTLANARFVELWRQLALRLKNHPAVFAYEIINEPFAARPNEELIPFYNQVGGAIRAIDPSRPIAVEPQVFTTSFSFNKLDLKRPALSNLVIAPHAYSAVAVLARRVTAYDYTSIRQQVNEGFGLASKWNVPMILGEFGTPADTVDARAFLAFHHDELDRLQIGGTQWNITPRWNPFTFDGWNIEDFSILDGSGALRPNFQPRPQLRRYSGDLVSTLVTYDKSNPLRIRAVQATIQNDPAKGSTILYVPPALIPSASVEVSGGATCEWRADKTLGCFGPSAGPVSITVTFQ